MRIPGGRSRGIPRNRLPYTPEPDLEVTEDEIVHLEPDLKGAEDAILDPQSDLKGAGNRILDLKSQI